MLAIRCQLGEPAAFDDLIAHWHTPLWSFVRRLVGGDDMEIVQDVWVRVIRGNPAAAGRVEAAGLRSASLDARAAHREPT